MRIRANLGGGLYGGRSASAEAENVGSLLNQFTSEDIGREETRKLNNQNIALAILQMLYPNSGIQSPSYINPVVSANTQFGTSSQENQTQAQIEQQTAATRAALQSAMWQSLGNITGDAIGAYGQMNTPVAYGQMNTPVA
jgi:hypothetical protein